MLTIYKYPFNISELTIIEMPLYAKIRHVGLDPTGQPCLWAELHTEYLERKDNIGIRNHIIRVFGTGQPILSIGNHIGSFKDGQFMWHVYHESPPENRE